MGVSPQALYNDFAVNGQLTRDYTASELGTCLESSSVALYGDPEIKARLDEAVLASLGPRSSPWTPTRLVVTAAVAICLAVCALLPWLLLRRRTFPCSTGEAVSGPASAPRPLDHLRKTAIRAPLLALLGLWLWLALSSGGYLPRHWLVYGLGLGFFGLLAAGFRTYPRQPRQLSLAVLGVFAGYCLWTTASGLWAESGSRVWLESARSFTYLLGCVLAAAWLTDYKARRLFRYLVLLGAAVLIAAAVVTLWAVKDLSPCFVDNRLSCPTGTPDSAAALFLLLFWPLSWLSAGPEERAPTRGAALGLATGLLALALLTRSLIGLCGLALSALFIFLASPARLRLLLHLFGPGLLMLYEFPTFRRYWTQGAEAVGGAPAARSLVTATLVAAFIGLMLALLERWVRVSRRMKVIFGTVVLAAVVAGLAYGGVQAAQEPGGPVKWATQLWQEVTGQTSEQAEEPAPLPLEEVVQPSLTLPTLSDRAELWKVAQSEFLRNPVLGVGTGNFFFSYDRLRTDEALRAQDPHSLELQVVSETGVIGGVLLFGAGLLALAGILWPRLRAARAHGERLAHGWTMALLAGAVGWFVQASLDCLWQATGVTVGALLLVAAALAEVDASKDPMWPRLRGLLGRLPDWSPRWPPFRSPGHSSRQSPVSLAQVFRVITGAVAALVLVLAGLPYLSLAYRESALASADADRAVSQAQVARWLLPSDPEPHLALGAVYERAARSLLGPALTQAPAATSAPTASTVSAGPIANPSLADQAGAVFDNLALALSSYQKAGDLEPAYWLPHFRAAVAAANLFAAEALAQGKLTQTGYRRAQKDFAGLGDWSSLAALATLAEQPPDPGRATGSLAKTDQTRAQATYYRGLAPADLAQLATFMLKMAAERNPLQPQVQAAATAIAKLRGHTY